MAIKSIRIKNVKGHTVNQELSGKDIFIGPNGSGKSTRLQALGFAMLGYVPGEGKKMNDTFELSSGDELSAGIQTDKFSFDRSINRNVTLLSDGTNSIKYNEGVSISPNKGEKTATQMNARIISEIGNFPVVFDFNQFTELSDSKQRDFMYDLSPITNDHWDKDRVLRHLTKTILTDELKGVSPEIFEAVEELIRDSSEHWPIGYDLTSGLQSLISWIDIQQKDWNKKKADATGAVRELDEMKNQLEETDRDIVSKKAELKKSREDHTDVHGQITAGKELLRQWNVKQERINAIKQEIESVVELLSKPNEVDYEAKTEEIRAKIVTTDIAEKSGEIQKQINALDFQKREKLELWTKVNQEIGKLESELHTYDSVVKNIQEKGGGICVLHSSIKCDKDFSGFTGFVTDNGAKIKETLEALKLDRTTLQTEGESLRDQIKLLEDEKATLHQTFLAETKRNETLRNEIESMRKVQQNVVQSRQDKLNQQTSLQEELNRIVGEVMPAFAPLDILEPQLTALAAQIAENERVIDEKEIAKTTLSNRQQAIISAVKAKHYYDASKKISDALGSKGIQGELVKSTLGPIEGQVNENLLLMGISNRCFFSTESETGKEVFQFGWVKDGRKTKFNALSKGEKLMFLSAFLVALLERANPPLKVLALDEIQNLDEVNMINVLKGLDALSHKLDNILIAGVVRESDLVGLDSWKVWNLTPETVV